MPQESNLILLKRAIHLSLSNIVRNKFLSIATVFVMGIILFIFNIILSVNYITESSLQSLSEKIDIVLYLKDNTPGEQTNIIVKELREVEGVTEVNYTSKDSALTKLKTLYPNIYNSFEKYSLKNPLPASISVKTLSPAYHNEIENFLIGSKHSKYISNISRDENQSSKEQGIISSVAKNLEKVTSFSKQIIFWVVLTFVIGGILIILNAIQMAIFTRRKEILIMRLVGARPLFIKLPFIIEAVMYAIGAVILNLIFLLFLSTEIATFVQNINVTALIIFELILTILIAITSSTIAVSLNVKKEL